jgi:hypothetical protein
VRRSMRPRTNRSQGDRRSSQGTWVTDDRPPRQPLQLPPNFRDVTAEKVGTVVAIVGATAAPKAKPK